MSGLWEKNFDLRGAAENEDVLVQLDKLFVELDKDNDIRKKIFEYDFRGLGISPNRPFIVKKIPPEAFGNSSLKNHFQIITTRDLSDENKKVLDLLMKTGVFEEDDLAWVGCENNHLTIVSVKQSSSNPRCGSCTRRPSSTNPIYYCNPRIIGLLSNPGKILEPFLLHRFSSSLKNNDVKLYWGAYINYKHKIKFWTRGSQEIDILIRNKAGKEMVILASINPSDQNEKRQFRLCCGLGIKTIFVTTKSNERSPGIFGPESTVLFGSIHTEKSINDLVGVVQKYFA